MTHPNGHSIKIHAGSNPLFCLCNPTILLRFSYSHVFLFLWSKGAISVWIWRKQQKARSRIQVLVSLVYYCLTLHGGKKLLPPYSNYLTFWATLAKVVVAAAWRCILTRLPLTLGYARPLPPPLNKKLITACACKTSPPQKYVAAGNWTQLISATSPDPNHLS
jgi:hypothetical protein